MDIAAYNFKFYKDLLVLITVVSVIFQVTIFVKVNYIFKKNLACSIGC